MKFPFTKRDPIPDFWQWFVENRAKITAMPPSNHILNELHTRLRRIDKGLVFQIGAEKGVWILEISGGGISELIPAVTSTVQAAPPLEGVEIRAFRSRSDEATSIEGGGVKLGMDDLWFKSQPSGDKLDIELFIDSMNPKNQKQMSEMSFLLLDALLGEFDVMTKVGAIDFNPLPADPVAMGLQQFKELRRLIDALP